MKCKWSRDPSGIQAFESLREPVLKNVPTAARFGMRHCSMKSWLRKHVINQWHCNCRVINHEYQNERQRVLQPSAFSSILLVVPFACGESAPQAPKECVPDDPRGECMSVDPLEGCVPDEPLEELKSTQKVTFQFSGSESLQVVTHGQWCAVFTISEQEGAQLLRHAPYMPVCEGASPPKPCAKESAAVDADVRIVWDARSLHEYFTCEDCAIWGRPEAFRHATYVRRPVAAGKYRATFSIIEPGEPPPDCNGFNNHFEIPLYYQLCLITRTVSVDFVLPEDGDVTIPIEVN